MQKHIWNHLLLTIGGDSQQQRREEWKDNTSKDITPHTSQPLHPRQQGAAMSQPQNSSICLSWLSNTWLLPPLKGGKATKTSGGR